MHQERLPMPKIRAAQGRGPVEAPDWVSLGISATAAVECLCRARDAGWLTLLLLWEEYRERHPDGVGYSWFCEIYGAWKSRLTPTMRQTHIAGERMLVD
jgi:hypothetical protein